MSRSLEDRARLQEQTTAMQAKGSVVESISLCTAPSHDAEMKHLQLGHTGLEGQATQVLAALSWIVDHGGKHPRVLHIRLELL